jgi:hypothetical protein
MRKLAIAVIAGGILIGAGLGTVVYAMAGQSERQSVTVAAAPAPPVAEPTKPTFADPVAIGAHGHLQSRIGKPTAMVWVERLAMSAFARAYEDRNGKEEQRILELFETLDVPTAVPVTVVNRSGDDIQVEILSAPYLGRRGWTDRWAFVREE